MDLIKANVFYAYVLTEQLSLVLSLASALKVFFKSLHLEGKRRNDQILNISCGTKVFRVGSMEK